MRFYQEDIRSQTLGNYKEYGNDAKSGFDVYKNVFDDLSSSIEKNNFCDQTSLIPLAADGSILNGAHRLTIALHQNKSLVAVSNKVCSH